MSNRSLRLDSDRIAKIMLVCSVLSGAWLYGVVSARYELFPYPQIRAVVQQVDLAVSVLMERSRLNLALYYAERPESIVQTSTYLPAQVTPGYILLSGMTDNDQQMVRLIDNDGVVAHEWLIDWFEIWPDATHLPEDVVPQSRPGTSIHGIVFLPNGDIVFNFNYLGLVRMDYCGAVVWRLPYRTHHSIHTDEDGNFWVGGLINHRRAQDNAPNHAPRFDEYFAYKISPDGRLLAEISILDVLRSNDLSGLLYLSTLNNWGTVVRGDTLHLNDVETFPENMAPGVFGPGDIMVSLRNINAIVVFNEQSREVKYLSIGAVLRQHDPDFVDGNTISVLDNNNLSYAQSEERVDERLLSSRIVEIDAVSGDVDVIFEGSADQPFFTDIMGKHQLLPNGNILVAESRRGRVFEVSRQGELVWEHYNLAEENLLGLIDEAYRLPPEVDSAALDRMARACPAP